MPKNFNIPSDEEFAENTVTTFRQETSYNGYNVGELKSWLQKSIRRGNLDDAAWAAVELYTLPKQGVVTNLFNRLRIISMEDIGVANPEAVKCTEKVLSSLETIKGKPLLPVKAEGVMKIAMLAVYLAKSKHLRLCSDYKAVFMTPDIRPGLMKLFPEIYTKSHLDSLSFESDDAKVLGGKMVKMLEQKDDCAFYLMAKILDLENLPFKTMKSQKPSYYILELVGKLAEKLKVTFSPEVEILSKWLKGGIINSKIDYNLPLYYAMIMVLKRDDMSDPNLKCNKISVEIKNFLPIKKIPKVPDYALDKHTAAGKKAGKTALNFVKEGALVENEDETLINPAYRKLYLRKLEVVGAVPQKKISEKKEKKDVLISKKDISEKKEKKDVLISKKDISGQKKIPLESDIINFDVRVQATVADHRSDTYFGIERSTGTRVFVKGPYKDENAAFIPVNIYEIKKLLDPKLPSIKLELKLMKPDLFPDLPWGFRRPHRS